ncbi:GMC oxidoreductase [Earliella scabrosa]|nr:GMC oxidoreductase [Earliella scabrosa]
MPATETKLASIAEVEGLPFDYVIIGGGTAGCVIARRLSEDPNVSVVVLEAGQSRLSDPLISGPMGWMKQLMNGDYDWKFPVEAWEGPNSQKVPTIPWSRAKSLGGSSTINLMAWTKPAREELDALESLGNPGWNWDMYQKYANKVEGFRTSDGEIVDPDYRNLFDLASVGTDGPVTLSFVPTGAGADGAYQKSLVNNGLNILTDALGGDVAGIWKGVSAVDPTTSTRVDAARAYLAPVLERSNLKVLTEAVVTRIVTDVDDNRVVARAVEFEHGGPVYRVIAKREVILSAGTIKTPQILELSGIGDREILEPLGVETVVDLPGVGANVQEHVAIRGPTFRMVDDKCIITTNMLKDTALMKEMRQRLQDYTLVINAFAFASIHSISDKAAALVERKKAELAANASSLPAGLRKQHELQLRSLESTQGIELEIMGSPLVIRPMPEPDKPYYTILPALARPWSRGTIHISSNDPKTNPRIDPGYFADEFDLDLLAEGFKFALKVADTEPFRELVKARVAPPPEQDLSTDEKVKEFIVNNIITAWHTCGSASMLPKELGGVVDPKLKVYGTKNIRVVDLSVLPLHISVHPQALVYTFAERAAGLIKESKA